MADGMRTGASRRDFLRVGMAAGAGLLLDGRLAEAQKPADPLSAAPPKLKVTDVKTYVLKTGQTLVEVFTDGGIAIPF